MVARRTYAGMTIVREIGDGDRRDLGLFQPFRRPIYVRQRESIGSYDQVRLNTSK
jgi:hypothetical protein